MLRIRVELIPHGQFGLAETLDEVFVTNDGSGTSTGPDEGGIGNYDVTRELGRNRKSSHLGRIENIPRSSKHRLDLAIRALQLLRRDGQPRKAGL